MTVITHIMSVVVGNLDLKLPRKNLDYEARATWESPRPWSPLMVKLFLFGEQIKLSLRGRQSRMRGSGNPHWQPGMESQCLSTAHAHSIRELSPCINIYEGWHLLLLYTNHRSYKHVGVSLGIIEIPPNSSSGLPSPTPVASKAGTPLWIFTFTN